MRKYIGPIKWLGGIALALFAFALIFEPLSQGLSEETRKSVLLHAVPFFATFVGVLLLFILLIAIIAMRYNGKVPKRAYNGVEFTIILGILFGVICLFQPWSDVPYRYGFLLLLGSTLSFILWSHFLPRFEKESEEENLGLAGWQRILAAILGLISGLLLSIESSSLQQLLWIVFRSSNADPFPLSTDLREVHGFYLLVIAFIGYFLWSRTFTASESSGVLPLRIQDKVIGLVVAGIVVVFLAVTISNINAPQPPYGLRERVYNSYNDERKAQVAVDATQKFRTDEFPFLIIFSVFPGMLVYFVAREVVTTRSNEQRSVASTVIVGSGNA
jgi:hypothetical protein